MTSANFPTLFKLSPKKKSAGSIEEGNLPCLRRELEELGQRMLLEEERHLSLTLRDVSNWSIRISVMKDLESNPLEMQEKVQKEH